MKYFRTYIYLCGHEGVVLVSRKPITPKRYALGYCTKKCRTRIERDNKKYHEVPHAG